ncbi:NnrU family protein [Sphingorhabdus arenilitoris]|uniref:NnrU family protein n=1 Tax=Sphingorhabdus arenilitoris TaxID=1490041 RepID=A0ABV8RFY0_9SPHN
MGGYLNLVLASLAFVGSHFAMSHNLRPAMVRLFGRNAFMAVYSLISLAALIWMVIAYRAVPAGTVYWPAGDILWAVSSVLTFIAAVLYSGSMSGNPALPSPGAAEYAGRMPAGVFRVTRHPMMWSFALWGFAHLLIAPRTDNFIFIGSIIFLALAGAKAQELKKAATMGVEWEMWCRRTHYFPAITGVASIGPWTWIIGTALWLIATWAHGWFDVPAAGLFRWIQL